MLKSGKFPNVVYGKSPFFNEFHFFSMILKLPLNLK
jgi:hypothetical protein